MINIRRRGINVAKVLNPKVKQKLELIENCMMAIKVSPTDNNLEKLRKVLDDTFDKTVCKTILYTNNIDKPFFGMCVMPDLSNVNMSSLLIDRDTSTANGKRYYALEFDSKLFEIGLTTRELTAILLHEIGHVVVYMEENLETLLNATDLYLAKNRENLDADKVIECNKLLKFGVEDALRRIGDIFDNEEKQADRVAVALGYGPELESALQKISTHIINLNKNVTNNKLIVFQWTLRVYKDIKIDRINAIRKMNKLIGMNGSQLENRRVEGCKRELTKLDEKLSQPSLCFRNDVEESVLMEKVNLNIFRQYRRKSMRTIEDELYEYALLVKSVEDQEDALRLMRDINSRLAIIDDYMSGNVDDHEKKKWLQVKEQYFKLREELSKKTTYGDSFYGLFIKTPVVKPYRYMDVND